MKSHMEKWIIGTALAVALPTLIPIIRKSAKPLVEQTTTLANGWIEQAKVLAVKAKHEMEDIWFEAQYERMKKNNWGRKSLTFTD